MSKVHFIDNNLAYCSEAAAIAVTTKPDLFTPGDKPISTPRGKIAPWGSDNNLPAHVAKLIEKSEVISSNINFLVETAYGHGIKPMMRIKGDDGQVRYEDCEDERVLKFFEDNDIGGYFLEQLYDLVTFSTVFPEIVVNGGGDSIVSLRHLEATFSRYGSIEENRGRITKHYYNSFEEGAVKGKLFVTPVLSRYNTLNEMQEAVTKGERRFVLELPMPTPGRIYYGRPAWWSIFSSGWFDISEMLPKFKKSLINNHLAVRYIVYISDSYWQELYRRNGVTEGTDEANAVRQEAVEKVMDFLVENKTKGGGMISTKKLMPSGGGSPFEDKYIEIEAVESPIKGGEFIEDAEEAHNIISYAMSVHPNLIGATPGKSKGSMGGTDKRELFMIQQAKMRPFVDRLLRPFVLIKRFNKWPENLVFAVPEFIFTTLDQDKTGKKTEIKTF